jgi:hypothetical protein
MSITPFNSVGGYSTGLTGYTVIDAVGGVSAAGGTFSALTRFTAGISASGATFSGDIAVNGGDITTTATTATIFNSTATTVSMGGANDSTINIGAGTGVTLNIGTGSLFGGTKNINIGTNGSFGTSIIQIGNSIAAVTINTGTFGITLGSATSPIRIPNTLTVGGGVTLGGRVDVGGVLDVVGGVTFESTSDYVGVARFVSGINSSVGSTFAADISVNTITVGRGSTSGAVSNTALGVSVLAVNSGTFNTGVGNSALTANTTGGSNTAVGRRALFANTTGASNTAIGPSALGSLQAGSFNTAIGPNSLTSTLVSNSTALGAGAIQYNSNGNHNTALGAFAGSFFGEGATASISSNQLTSGTGGVYIGYYARGSTLNQSNEIVIGMNAVGLGSNTAVIGATSQTAARIYGTLSVDRINSSLGLTAYGNGFIGNDTRIRVDSDNLRIFIGDELGANNATLFDLDDGNAVIKVESPYGNILLGDPDSVNNGYSIDIDSSNGSIVSSYEYFEQSGGYIQSETGYRIGSSAINAQTGTTYTFLDSDNGKIVTFNNGSAVTVTIPTGLPTGFNCTAIQLGAGQVGFTAASGLTLNSYGNQYRLIGQHASASIIEYTANTVNLSGNLVV